MLKYTFSNREKFMLAALAFVLLGLLWYRLVFSGVQDRLSAIASEQATAEDTITLDMSRLQRQQQMQTRIEQYKAQGVQPKELPAYDNLALVMAELNSVLGRASTYSLNFDQLSWTDDGYVSRGASLTFTCNSYNEAKEILTALYSGSFPCQIDSLALSDATMTNTGTSSAPVQASAHFSYYEQVTDTSPTNGLPAKPE